MPSAKFPTQPDAFTNAISERDEKIKCLEEQKMQMAYALKARWVQTKLCGVGCVYRLVFLLASFWS